MSPIALQKERVSAAFKYADVSRVGIVAEPIGIRNITSASGLGSGCSAIRQSASVLLPCVFRGQRFL